MLYASHSAYTCNYYRFHQSVSLMNQRKLAQAVGCSGTRSPQPADLYLESRDLSARGRSTRGWENWKSSSSLFAGMQRVCVMVSGELSVICRSKPNKINQANLSRGHSGFPRAIKMFKPLNISDLFSCIPCL